MTRAIWATLSIEDLDGLGLTLEVIFPLNESNIQVLLKLWIVLNTLDLGPGEGGPTQLRVLGQTRYVFNDQHHTNVFFAQTNVIKAASWILHVLNLISLGRFLGNHWDLPQFDHDDYEHQDEEDEWKEAATNGAVDIAMLVEFQSDGVPEQVDSFYTWF